MAAEPQIWKFYGEFLWQGFRNEIDDRLLEEPLYGGQSYQNLVFRPGTNLVSSGTVVNPGGNLFSFQGGTFNRTDTFQYAGGMRFNQNRLPSISTSRAPPPPSRARPNRSTGSGAVRAR